MARLKWCAGCERKTTSRIHELFKVHLCRNCTYSQAYKCIGITKVKKQYGLNDEDLSGVPFNIKENPYNKARAPLWLFEKKVIVAIAEGKKNAFNIVNQQIPSFVSEAPDQVIDKIIAAINQRMHQSKFRTNQLKVYNCTCVVSNVKLESVLDAAHIDTYARSGNNNSVNGLLLRKDLHNLFDLGLLLIHPYDLTVRLCPAIAETEYKQYNGKRINDRSDGKKPNKELLIKKWNSAQWIGEWEKLKAATSRPSKRMAESNHNEG